MVSAIRQCPQCTMPLEPIVRHAAEVDFCPACGGTFLDGGELAAILPAAANPASWQREGLARPRGSGTLLCPAHPRKERPTMARWVVRRQEEEVEIDACPSCAGVWLGRREEGRLLAIARAVSSTRSSAAEVAVESGELSRAEADRFLATLKALDGFDLIAIQRGVRRRVVVWVLIVANVLCAAAALRARLIGLDLERLARAVSIVPTELLDGRGLHRLVTHAFFHASVGHLAGNMLYLWIFGRGVEVYFGRTKLVALYVASLLGGALLHIALFPSSDVPALGASGAISGLIAAHFVVMPDTVVFAKRRDARVVSVLAALLFVGQQLVVGALGNTHIAFAAHLGGFATGALLALGMRRFAQRP